MERQNCNRSALLIAIVILMSLGAMQGQAYVLQERATAARNAGGSKTPTTKLLAWRKAVIPAEKSVWWYYNRAIIYHLQEKDGQATIELYRALEQDPQHQPTLYFLAILYKDREKWADIVTTLVPMVAHTPQLSAQLLLARAYGESEQYFAALDLWEKLAKQLKLGGDFLAKIAESRQIAKPPPRRTLGQAMADQKAKKQLPLRLRQLAEDAEALLLDDLDNYRQLITAQDNVDPLVYQELISFYLEEPDAKGIGDLLADAFQQRGYFAPDLLLYAGRVCRDQQQVDQAVEYLEQAINQLRVLGFSEAAGDFYREEIDELRAAPHQPKNEPKPDNAKPRKR
jgi:uncharacterized protein HemY